MENPTTIQMNAADFCRSGEPLFSELLSFGEDIEAAAEALEAQANANGIELVGSLEDYLESTDRARRAERRRQAAAFQVACVADNTRDELRNTLKRFDSGDTSAADADRECYRATIDVHGDVQMTYSQWRSAVELAMRELEKD